MFLSDARAIKTTNQWRITGIAEHACGGQRLRELGLRAGSTVRVVRRTSGGGAILALGEDRLALASGVLRWIEVEALPPSAAPAPWPRLARGAHTAPVVA